MSEYHIPVMLDPSVSALITTPDGIYADATFGGGGHTAEILSRLHDGGRVIAFDRDVDAIEGALKDSRLKLVHNNFRFIENYAALEGVRFDGILADLGVSSHQFDGLDEAALERILRLYGEVDNARRAAALIVRSRSEKPLETTGDLDRALAPILPRGAEHKVLAKVYQALRIEVNQEMRSLEKFLSGAARSLKEGGRLVVITYHSLEDRMVKNFIRCGNVEGNEVKDIYGQVQAPLEAVSRKPVLPCEEEIAANTRARSAKLRVAVKRSER